MTRMTGIRSWSRRGRRGFTLIEVMLVVAIVGVLVGLTVAAGFAVVQRQYASATASTLDVLDAAYAEFKATSGREMTYGVEDEPSGVDVYEVWQIESGSVTEDELSRVMEEFMYLLARSPRVEDVLARIPDDQLRRLNTDYRGEAVTAVLPLDGWERPVIVVMAGRTWTPADNGLYPQDEDGTIRTPTEQALGLPARGRKAYFASAGPDGLFGMDWEGLPADETAEARGDNVYSYEVEGP